MKIVDGVLFWKVSQCSICRKEICCTTSDMLIFRKSQLILWWYKKRIRITCRKCSHPGMLKGAKYQTLTDCANEVSNEKIPD